MNTLFDPTILFISNKDWQDEEIRDAFLQHLRDNLSQTDKLRNCGIFWTNELDQLLYQYAYSPPWILDRDWKLQLIPLLARQFEPIKVQLTNDGDPCKCTISPMLTITEGFDGLAERFLELGHMVLIRTADCYLSLGLPNRALAETSLEITCDCHSGELHPRPISSPDDWLRYIDISNDYWPSDQGHDGIMKLKEALELIRKVELSSHNRDFICDCDFAPSFMRNIIRQTDGRKEILCSLAKRLLLTQSEASSDAGLHDEPLQGRGNRNVRRFRVTLARRIHYSYSREGRIEFLKYYGEGQHDEGL